MKRFVLIFIFMFFAQINFAQNEEFLNDSIVFTREFRGYFDNIRDMVRIQFQQRDTIVNGFMQFEDHKNKKMLIGTFFPNGNITLYEIDDYEFKTGLTIRAEIIGNIMEGTLVHEYETRQFSFKEIDLDSPPDFVTTSHQLYMPFEQYQAAFFDYGLPATVKYDKKLSQVRDLIGFMDKPIRKVGVYDPTITLMDRADIITRLSGTNRIKLKGGNVGLIIQAHFEEWVDGQLYAVYCFIYSSEGLFIDAIVLYESVFLEGKPNIYTKISSSKVFKIFDLDKSFEFSIEEDGSFRFRDHD